MRQDIPLREITIEEIYKDVQKLRSELQAHNHLDIGNAQVLTGTLNGITQSSNFVSGSAGCKINWVTGNLEANSGYFRGDISGASGTFSGTLTGGSLNIPDLVSANSFHVNSSGDAWWGCNVADFNSDIGNATAYVLKSGITKFATDLTGARITGSGSALSLFDNSVSDVGTYPSAEDLTTFTIQNDFATLSATASRATFALTHTRDTEVGVGESGGAFVYKDYGVGHFNSSFTQYLTVCCTKLGDYRTFAYWALSNSIGDMRAHAAYGPLPGIFLYIGTSIHSYPTLSGIEYVGDGSFAGYDMILGFPYYLTIKFDSTVGTYGTLYVYIYSDSARIHLLATRTMTLGAAMSYRYLYVYSSYNDEANLNTSSGFSDTLILGVEEASVTGSSAQIILPSTSDVTQRFLINRRKSYHSADDGVLEIYSDKAPDNSRFNWLFIGRKGYETGSGWNVSSVDITTKSRFEILHSGVLYGPAYLILPSDDTSDVGDPDWGKGLAGSTRQMMAFQADPALTASTLSSGTFTGGGFMAFGYYGVFGGTPAYGVQMYLDTGGIHFLDSIFGAWVDISSNYDGDAHQVTQDGFIVAVPSAGVAGTLLSDSSNPPTTKRADIGVNAVTNVGCTIPIKMGDYYKWSVYTGSPKIYWLPFG